MVYDNDTFIGAGGVSFYQVMSTYHNPSGKKAYIEPDEESVAMRWADNGYKDIAFFHYLMIEKK